jgi:VanZ family protein
MHTESYPNRERSGHWRRLTAIVLAIYWVALFGSTHIPRLPLPTHISLFDKICHFVAFAMLALLVNLAWASRRSGLQPIDWRMFAKVLLVIAIYGAIDEFTQPWVGRSRELLDWLADVTGALFATLVFAGLWTLARCVARPRGDRMDEASATYLRTLERVPQ